MIWESWALVALAIIAFAIAATDSIMGLFFNVIPYMRRFGWSWPMATRVARDLNNASFLIWIVVAILANLPQKVVVIWFGTIILSYIIIRLIAWKTHPQGIKGLQESDMGYLRPWEKVIHRAIDMVDDLIEPHFILGAIIFMGFFAVVWRIIERLDNPTPSDLYTLVNLVLAVAMGAVGYWFGMQRSRHESPPEQDEEPEE